MYHISESLYIRDNEYFCGLTVTSYYYLHLDFPDLTVNLKHFETFQSSTYYSDMYNYKLYKLIENHTAAELRAMTNSEIKNIINN